RASERRRGGRALAPEGATEPRERLGRRVDEVEQPEVLLRDHPVAHERREIDDLAPVARPIQEGHDRPRELAGLAEGQDLEQLVERAEAAGKDDDGAREVREPELAHEEVVELEREAGRDVGVRALLMREADVGPEWAP